jgi:FkbM family methyltransferase
LLLLPPFIINGINWIRVRSGKRARSELPQSTTEPQYEHVGRVKDEGEKYWGLNNLDQKIEKYLNFDCGFYVELGANDGKQFSNTYYYETNRGWRGVLIEPAPNKYLECVKNRSSHNYVACAACVSFGYKEEFVKMVYCDLMSVPVNLESDIDSAAAHAERGQQFLRPNERIFTFGAAAATLNSILIDAQAPNVIDFLSLDVEGAEIEVLKGVDHGIFKFKYPLIECRDIAKLERYLAPLNYRIVEKFDEHDYLFSRT